MNRNDFQDVIGDLVDKAISEAKTTADCEEHFFFKGISVFIKTYSGDNVNCTVDGDDSCYRITVKNHRPHRIYISAFSNFESQNLMFNTVQKSSWQVRKEVKPCKEENAFSISNSANVDWLDTELAPREESESDEEQITTEVECKVIDPESKRPERNYTDSEYIVVDLV